MTKDSQKWSSSTEAEIQKQLKVLELGVIEITPKDDFVKMLGHSIENNKPLRVKCGIDPTGSDVHLGHTIPYRKMKQFQDLGHQAVVIIGDYTAQIGDPTGKNESRPSLSADQVKINGQKYFEQVATVLDKTKTEVRFQSEWFSKITLNDVMSWAHQTTVAKLLSHDTFKHRLDSGSSLGLHELFYPVLQGIDSVFVKADVELGGSDQKFNVLMGRDYQKNAGLRPQVAILLPIITGICGTQKMSKSLNNYIGVLDDPFDKFGKVMSIPDQLMNDYAQYVSNFSWQQCQDFSQKLKDGSLHPNEAKKMLASSIVSLFHGNEVGQQMRLQFEQVFAKKQTPDDVEEFKISGSMTLIQLLVQSGAVASNSEAKRMITQNAVSIVSGDKLIQPDLNIGADFENKTIKIGKRKFIKIII